MTERFTSDLPAVPDPEYVWHNPERKKDVYERALEEPDVEIPESMRTFFTEIVEAKNSKTPIQNEHLSEAFFDSLNAQEFIDDWAVYDDDGRLNMDLTSAKIGIPYNYNIESNFASGETVGLPGHPNSTYTGPIEIRLDPKSSLHQVTFGHEIGHYFWRVTHSMGTIGYDRMEEDFCDYFGRRMALPTKELAGYETIDETTILAIMSRFRSDLSDTITALMETELLPSRVAIDSYLGSVPNLDYSEKVHRGVFCLHCMQTGGDYNCPNVGQPTPLFDFTDRAWGDQMGSCLGENLHRPDIMSTLTKWYMANEVQLVLFRP